MGNGDPRAAETAEAAAEPSGLRADAALFVAFAVLFLVTCIKTRAIVAGLAALPQLGPLLDQIAESYATPRPNLVAGLKQACFLAALGAAFAMAIARGGFERPRVEAQDRVAALAALALIALLAGIPPALGSWGQLYMQMSLQPFLDAAPVIDQFLYRRVLQAFVAHVVQLDGVLFPTFNWILTFVLLLLVRLFLRREGCPASIMVLASVGSCQFVFYNYILPGYPDQLVYIFGLVAVLYARSAAARLVLLGAALLAHEALALAVFLPLILFRFPPRELARHGALIALYAVAWLAGQGGNLLAAVTAQTTSGANSPAALLLARPELVPLAALVTLKFLWLSLGATMRAEYRSGNMRALGYLAFAAALPLASAPVALDLSRLFAAGFIAGLLGLAGFARLAPPAWFRALVVANLVAPSFYVGLNIGGIASDGLYGLVVGRFFERIS